MSEIAKLEKEYDAILDEAYKKTTSHGASSTVVCIPQYYFDKLSEISHKMWAIKRKEPK